MNPWYAAMIELAVLFMLFVCFIVLLIMIIIAKRKHQPLKIKSALLFLDVMLFAFSLVFVLSHSTYYKYNDWTILGSHISDVQKQYGDFDLNIVQTGHSGHVGYYIYTDNGPVMPDYLPHYYYIHYDENGIVDSVTYACAEGG